MNLEVFFQSVRSGDYAAVKRLIEEGMDVNTQNNNGSTALMWASQGGHLEVIKLLIEAGI
jgi:ankyrin repeat protein